MFSFWGPAAPPAAPTDYGKMWDEHHDNPRKLAQEAGIPAAWMRNPQHRPKDRQDFIDRMSSDYYTNFTAAGHGDQALPICVGLALTQVICSILPAKYDKRVSPKAVIAAIYAACPEMFEEGIRADEAIDKCNKAHNGKGLIIPGPTLGDAYRVQLKPHFFTHREYCQALTMADSIEKLGCRAMAVVVRDQLDPPLHAMVTSSVGYSKGAAAMSAFDLCNEAEREQAITNETFHQLIVCSVDACEQLRGGNTQELSAKKGFQKRFDSDLARSRGVTKLKSPGGCGPMSCGRAQMDELQFNEALLDSIRVAQESFTDFQQKLEALRVNFKNEFEGDFPKLDAVKQAASGFAVNLSASLSAARRGEQSLPTFPNLLEQSGFNDEKIKGFSPRLMTVLEQSGFDEEMLEAFRLVQDDLWRSLARKCLS